MSRTKKKKEKEVMSKVQQNKADKQRRILEAAYKLFLEKGFKETTISDITDEADVAKGTFYLYFEDKYDIQDYLIVYKLKELFLNAINNANKKHVEKFDDRIIAIIDYMIDAFQKNKKLLHFVSKNLSWGVFGNEVSETIDKNTLGVCDIFRKEIEDCNVNIKNPELTIFMIMELTSSVVFSSIMTNKPLSIEEMKPFLYDKIRKMIGTLSDSEK